jgi:hypothetical protein
MKLFLVAVIQETEFVWNSQAAALPTAPRLLAQNLLDFVGGGGKHAIC